jgi:hypothetical protein
MPFEQSLHTNMRAFTGTVVEISKAWNGHATVNDSCGCGVADNDSVGLQGTDLFMDMRRFPGWLRVGASKSTSAKSLRCDIIDLFFFAGAFYPSICVLTLVKKGSETDGDAFE